MLWTFYLVQFEEKKREIDFSYGNSDDISCLSIFRVTWPQQRDRAYWSPAVGWWGLAGHQQLLILHSWPSKSRGSVPEEEHCFGRISEKVSILLFWNYFCLLHFNYSKFWQVSGRVFILLSLALAVLIDWFPFLVHSFQSSLIKIKRK